MQKMSGIFQVIKPMGITSHDVVDRLRKITGERTIGHAGTLDPMAEGLMIVAIGKEFTKQIQNFVGLDKEYVAEITLGAESTTYDKEGELTDVGTDIPSLSDVVSALNALTGTYDQMPPKFSAKKIQGKKAYELARAGKEVLLTPKEITVYENELIDYSYPLLKIRTKVSSGTYIRTLAHDLGQRLKTGAYLSSLVRTSIGPYILQDACGLDDLKLPTDLEFSRVKL